MIIDPDRLTRPPNRTPRPKPPTTWVNQPWTQSGLAAQSALIGAATGGAVGSTAAPPRTAPGAGSGSYSSSGGGYSGGGTAPRTSGGNANAWSPSASPADDAAWAEQFQRTYGRPPSDYDWNYRWHSDVGTPGYGSGYGGGGGSAVSGLPAEYRTGFEAVFGPAATFYGASPAQAAADYESLANLWQNATGTPIQPTDWTRIWGLLSTAKPAGRAPVWSDIYTAAQRYLARPPSTANVSHLNTSEI